MMQAMQQQQQHQAKSGMAHRGSSKSESILLPFTHKPPLVASSSYGSLGQTDSSGQMEMGALSMHHNRSPTLTPKASLTPTNSVESTASNGRSSPNIGAPSPSSGQEIQSQVRGMEEEEEEEGEGQEEEEEEGEG